MSQSQSQTISEIPKSSYFPVSDALEKLEESEKPTCLHCGDQLLMSSSVFCCGGCEFLYQLLHPEADDSFLQQARERFSKKRVSIHSTNMEDSATSPAKEAFSKASSVSAATSSTYQKLLKRAQWSILDDPAVRSEFAFDNENSMKFHLEGLDCAACIWALEKLPEYCPDLLTSRVNMSESSITVRRRSPQSSFAEIARRIDEMGFEPRLWTTSPEAEARRKKEERRHLVRIGVAATGASNIMILAVSLYSGAQGQLAWQFRVLSALLAAPVLLYSAWPFYRNVWSGFQTQPRYLSLDFPIVAALVAGVIASLVHLYKKTGDVYFDSLSMLVFLLLSSRYLLRRVQGKLLDSSRLQAQFILSSVERFDSQKNEWEKVSSLELRPQDRIRIQIKKEETYAIETCPRIPVDGVVYAGEGWIDNSALTGESRPRRLVIGDRVEAGSLALEGEWEIEVTASGVNTRMAQLLKVAEDQIALKPRLSRFTESISRLFTYTVMASALLLIFYFTFAQNNPAEGWERALALTIVACPCVFGMAIPLALSQSLAQASQRGIVIKDSEALERWLRAQRIAFDKTGTLTQGALRVREVIWPDKQVKEEAKLEILSLVAALEKNQPHPVGIAIYSYLKSLGVSSSSAIEPSSVRRRPEGGVEAQLNKNMSGQENDLARHAVVRLVPVPSQLSLMASNSNSKYHQNSSATHPEESLFAHYHLELASSLASVKATVAVELVLEDSLKPEAAQVLKNLNARGRKLAILSGDRSPVVQMCQKQLGLTSAEIELLSELTPEEKVRWIKTWMSSSDNNGVVMVGDGVNDAAALAAGSVGIAVRGSMEASLRAADIYLMNSSLKSLLVLEQIAISTQRAIRRSLMISGGFNLFSASLAISGFMTPLFAAILMPLSSFTVLLSTWRFSKWK